MAGRQEQEDHRHQLVLGEAVAGLFRLDEGGHQPAARLHGLAAELVADVLQQLAARR